MKTHAALEMCEVCCAHVKEVRRGRCWGCYSRWAESRPVGLGASCVVCGDRRRHNLKSVELLGAWWASCHNCAARAAALDPMPRSLAAIRRALRRDRRAGDRRSGATDPRVFRYDRRTGERRRARDADAVDLGDELVAVDDDMILEISDLAELTEEIGALAAAHSSPGDAAMDLEMTRIIDLS